MSEARSYDLKIQRAEKHLIDLEYVIDAWADTHPYEVRVGQEGKRQTAVHRFFFTEDPPDDVAIIAADFVYNIHSCLSHLAATLVNASRRTKTMFPIFWQGVWEQGPEGENAQRVKDRARWQSAVRTMDEAAVAIIKEVQPPDLGRDNHKSTAGLAVINRLRNQDAHSKLPVVASRLIGNIGGTLFLDARTQHWRGTDLRYAHGLENGAKLHNVPAGAVNVKISGTPAVVVDIGLDGGGVHIPRSFRKIAFDGTSRLIELLRPYDRL